MINRMDNICEAVLKGKWPVHRRHIFDFPSSLMPGSTGSTAAVALPAESPLQRQSLAELTMAGLHSSYGGSEDSSLLSQVHVSVPCLKTVLHAPNQGESEVTMTSKVTSSGEDSQVKLFPDVAGRPPESHHASTEEEEEAED